MREIWNKVWFLGTRAQWLEKRKEEAKEKEKVRRRGKQSVALLPLFVEKSVAVDLWIKRTQC
jgi:nitrate reductase alpha subunit